MNVSYTQATILTAYVINKCCKNEVVSILTYCFCFMNLQGVEDSKHINVHRIHYEYVSIIVSLADMCCAKMVI